MGGTCHVFWIVYKPLMLDSGGFMGDLTFNGGEQMFYIAL